MYKNFQQLPNLKTSFIFKKGKVFKKVFKNSNPPPKKKFRKFQCFDKSCFLHTWGGYILYFSVICVGSACNQHIAVHSSEQTVVCIVIYCPVFVLGFLWTFVRSPVSLNHIQDLNLCDGCFYVWFGKNRHILWFILMWHQTPNTKVHM